MPDVEEDFYKELSSYIGQDFSEAEEEDPQDGAEEEDPQDGAEEEDPQDGAEEEDLKDREQPDEEEDLPDEPAPEKTATATPQKQPIRTLIAGKYPEASNTEDTSPKQDTKPVKKRGGANNARR